jgi:hypothetical protein
LEYRDDRYHLGPPSFDWSPQLFVGSVGSTDERGTVAFTVSLDVASAAPTTVDYATADGTATAGADYVAASGTLVFDPGDLSKTVEVRILEDPLPEGDETFELVLVNPVGASVLVSSGTATIEDDDELRPNLVLSKVAAPPAVSSGAAFTVRHEVRNVGEVPATASHLVVGLSPRTVLETRAVPSLGPGGSSRGETTVTLPTLPTGAYQLVVLADSDGEVEEATEWDNLVVKQLLVGPEFWVTVTLTPAPTASVPTTITVRTKNVGSDTTMASVTRLYRSADRQLDAGDALLGEFPVPALAPKATSENAVTVTLPAGTYSLIAQVDATNAVIEARETNNLTKVRLTVP